jgi:hypothetical protein
MENSSAALIAKLESQTRVQLLDRWRELYGKPAPTGIRRELIIPFLAYRIQEDIEGGLSTAAKAMLKLAKQQADRQSRLGNRHPLTPTKPGTRVLRHWKGAVHEVDVTETAYEYRGHKYRSLSEIARQITGTRWSGPAFFGLKKTKSPREQTR